MRHEILHSAVPTSAVKAFRAAASVSSVGGQALDVAPLTNVRTSKDPPSGCFRSKHADRRRERSRRTVRFLPTRVLAGRHPGARAERRQSDPDLRVKISSPCGPAAKGGGRFLCRIKPRASDCKSCLQPTPGRAASPRTFRARTGQ